MKMINVLTKRMVKDLPKPIEYDFGDDVILRYYKVDDIDPILDKLAMDLRGMTRYAGKLMELLEKNGLEEQAKDIW